MALEIARVILRKCDSFGTIVHAQQDALATSKIAGTKALFDDRAPERMVSEQPYKPDDTKRDHGTAGKIRTDLERECRARKNEQRDDPQNDDLARLQI